MSMCCRRRTASSVSALRGGGGLALSAALLLVAVGARAAFEDLGAGARAPGMGNAFVAVADDVYAIHYNPAGLGILERPQLGAAYTKLYLGLTDNSDLGTSFVGYAHPLEEGRYGTVGAAWNAFTLNNIYREDTLYVSYGRLLYTDIRGGELNGGLSLKYLRSGFGSFPETSRATRDNLVTTQADPVLSGGSSQSAIDSDLGLLYRFSKHYAVGMQMTHVNQPNVAFSSNDTDRLPLGVKIGFDYRSLISNLVVQYNTQNSPAGTRDHVLTFAGERWLPRFFVGDFGARGGIGIGSREFAELSMGLSYRVRRFVLDYAYAVPLRGPTSSSGSHRFGLTFRFGRTTDEEESLEMILEAMREMRTGGTPERYRVDSSGLGAAERATLEERLAHSRFMEISARYKEALDRFDDALRLAPKDKDLLAHRERLVQVALRFPQLPDYRTDPVEAALQQGARAYLAGQDELAVQKISAALGLRPEDRRISDFLEAVEKETGARRPAVLPGRKPADYTLASKITRAETAVEEKRYGDAVEICLDVLREEENNVDAWQILGTAYFALRDYDASLNAWNKAYELQKSPSLRAAIKGHIRSIERLRGRGGKEERPVPAAASAPQPKPKLSAEEVRRLYDEGVQYYLKRDLSSARRAFERILSSDPFNAEAAKALSRIREEQP